MDFSPIFKRTRNLFSGKKVEDLEKTLLLTEKMPMQPDSLPLAVSDRYQIRRALGQGAFGIVYLAEDRRIGRLVAIKQLFKSYVKDPDIHERFMQEARIGAQLDHPNIINVFAMEEDEKSSCIIMEYLGGGSLNSFIRKEKGKGLDIPTSVRIILGVLAGLDAAHRVMIIHRDIKPQNILFGPQGDPKITDFGIAHLPIDAGGAGRLSKSRQALIGTPLYMAPEQLARGEIDHRADLYSVGVVMAEMLTGEKIYRLRSDMNMAEIADMVLNSDADTSGLEQAHIPPALSECTRRLLNKDPNARFASAREAAIEIEKSIPGSALTSSSSGSDDEMPRVSTYGPLLSSPAAMLEDVLRLLLVDGVLSPAERREVDRRAERLGISPLQARAIEDKVREELALPSLRAIKEYSAIVEAFFTSNSSIDLSKQQRRYLMQKRSELNIPEDECPRIERQIRDQIAYMRRLAEE